MRFWHNFYSVIFVGLKIFVYIYLLYSIFLSCLDVQWHSLQFEVLEVTGSTPSTNETVLNLSAPEILQRPAPQPGAPLFGAPRPERPSAPANPVPTAGNLCGKIGCAPL